MFSILISKKNISEHDFHSTGKKINQVDKIYIKFKIMTL